MSACWKFLPNPAASVIGLVLTTLTTATVGCCRKTDTDDVDSETPEANFDGRSFATIDDVVDDDDGNSRLEFPVVVTVDAASETVVVDVEAAAVVGELVEKLPELDDDILPPLSRVWSQPLDDGPRSETTPLSSELRTRVSSMLNSPARRIDLNDDIRLDGGGSRFVDGCDVVDDEFCIEKQTSNAVILVQRGYSCISETKFKRKSKVF